MLDWTPGLFLIGRNLGCTMCWEVHSLCSHSKTPPRWWTSCWLLGGACALNNTILYFHHPYFIPNVSVSILAHCFRWLVNHSAIGINGQAFCGQRWLAGVPAVVTPGSRWVSRAHARRKHTCPANIGSSVLQLYSGTLTFSYRSTPLLPLIRYHINLKHIPLYFIYII